MTAEHTPGTVDGMAEPRNLMPKAQLDAHMADLAEFLAWSDAVHGPVPAELMDEVRRLWPDPNEPDGQPPSSSTAKG